MDKKDIFTYLDSMQKSGKVKKLIDRIKYVSEEFGIEREEAKILVAQWTRIQRNKLKDSF